MAITQSTLQRIKSAPLSTVVEAFGGSLKRVGHEFLNQCLWHEDTNPSLTISDQKGFCFCHVCRQGGDATDYVQQKLGVGMREAAEKAAEILGVKFETDDEDPELAAKRREQRNAHLRALVREQEGYAANLHNPKAGRIRQQLKDRGFTRETAKEFGLGYAPSGFFGGRITVPIYNHRSELVGWTGRTTRDQPGKYKNSADSDLFNKKQLVFNEQRAIQFAKEAGSLIFVEGHLDVCMMHQYGIKNVVAAQGTGAPDISVLQRLARNIKTFILCFDGDAGGRKAAEQFIAAAGSMAMNGECSISVATLPEGEDPDSLLRNDGDLYHYIASAPSWLDWVIDTWAQELDHSDTAMMTEVESRLRKLISGLKSAALRNHYTDKAARILSSSEKDAKKLAEQWDQGYHPIEALEWTPRDLMAAIAAAERRMLRLYVHRPATRDALKPLLGNLTSPPLVWLSERLQELEELSDVDLTPHSVMAVVCVAEPHYMNMLRTIVRPNVILDDSPLVVSHLQDILGSNPS